MTRRRKATISSSRTRQPPRRHEGCKEPLMKAPLPPAKVPKLYDSDSSGDSDDSDSDIDNQCAFIHSPFNKSTYLESLAQNLEDIQCPLCFLWIRKVTKQVYIENHFNGHDCEYENMKSD